MKSIYNLLVYIVRCRDGSFYTGITNDLELRIAQHNAGIVRTCYTYKRRPVELVFAYGFDDRYLAIEFEKQIKGWSRAKKEALLQWDWDKIHTLARCKNTTSHTFYKQPDSMKESNDLDK